MQKTAKKTTGHMQMICIYVQLNIYQILLSAA